MVGSLWGFRRDSKLEGNKYLNPKVIIQCGIKGSLYFPKLFSVVLWSFSWRRLSGGCCVCRTKGTIQHPGFWLQKGELRKLDLTVWVWGLLRGKHPWLTFRGGPAQVVFPSCFWGVSKLLFDRTEAMCMEPLQNWTKLNEKVCSCLIYQSLSSRPSSCQMAASLPPCPDFLKPCYVRPSAGQQFSETHSENSVKTYFLQPFSCLYCKVLAKWSQFLKLDKLCSNSSCTTC